MTPDALALIIESLRAGVLLPAALKAARVRADAFDDALAADDDVRAQVRAAEREGLAHASAVTKAPPIPAGFFASVAAPKREAVATANAPQHAKGPSVDGDAVDWQRVHEEAREMAPGPFGYVLWQEEALAQSGAGFPRLSPYSLWAIEGFFASLKRWMLLLGGRGYGKSTFTARLASVLGLFTARKMAPGPSWVCPIVSVLPIDAERRLEDVQAIVRHAYHLELKIALAKSTIVTKDALDNPIAWVSSASTIGNVSGPSSFAALVDEEEKIRDAGAIIGSLAYTFRSRQGVRGFRVSSAMAAEGTLATDCARGQTITNYVATLGPFLDDALLGLHAVANWEEAGDATQRRAPNPEAARQIRAYAASLTANACGVPTWLGHPSIGNPDERANWTPGDAAIATRIEAEGVPEAARDGLAPWRYWLRECASVPTAADDASSGGQIEGLADLNRQLVRDVGRAWDGRRIDDVNEMQKPPDFNGGGWTGGGGVCL